LRQPVDDGAGSDLAGALDAVRRNAHRRGMVAVISDFVVPDGWQRSLNAIGRRHDLLALEVIDPRELTLPDVGLVRLVDPETGRQRDLDTSKRSIREKYEQAAAAQRAAIAASLREAGADHLQLRTDRDWVMDLVGFVGRRKARRLAARGGRR
jgi:uncharacterized protein (DUF58 family)